MNNEKITAYKGFNKDLTCRGFQYEVGKEYEMDGDIEVCERGFHACESPLEVINQYFLDENADFARFCEVEQSGKIKCERESTKVASSHIKIKAELKLADLIKLGVEWIKEKTSTEKVDDKIITDDCCSAQIGSSGYSAVIGSSGYYAQIGSSGYGAVIGSSGYSAKIGSSGDSAQIGSSGYGAVICCAGHNSVVRAKKGSWITLSEWSYDDAKKCNIPVCVKTEFVDGERIKADTWYKLVDGEFVEQ